MAVLDPTGRARVSAAYMRQESGSFAFSKPDLTSAIPAADQWLEDGLAEFNLALPPAFRSRATPAQKLALLAYILWRRIGRLRTAEDG